MNLRPAPWIPRTTSPSTHERPPSTPSPTLHPPCRSGMHCVIIPSGVKLFFPVVITKKKKKDKWRQRKPHLLPCRRRRSRPSLRLPSRRSKNIVSATGETRVGITTLTGKNASPIAGFISRRRRSTCVNASCVRVAVEPLSGEPSSRTKDPSVAHAKAP